jgi:hypothetical protein
MSKLIYSCILLLVASVGVGSCRCNSKYCEGAPDNNCDNLADGSERCTSNEQCEEPTAVCDVTGSMTCVQCTPDQASACGGKTPTCGEDHMCRACRAHSECPDSDTCLPDGSCADPGQVAYVQPPALGGTANPSCTLAMPCTKVASALQTGRPYVKLAGTNDEGGTLSIDSRNVTLLAERDAKLVRTSNGLHVEIRGTSQVAIYDLEISGASGAQGIGLSIPAGATATVTLTRVKVSGNQAGGISASGGSLTVSQGTISGNTGAGITTSTGVKIDITNCFIFKNGNSTTAIAGGLYLARPDPASVLAFNTIVDNHASSGTAVAGGVYCDDPGFTASNNIIARNFVNDVANQGNSNTFGQCTHATTTITSTIAGLNFVSPDNAPHNYHLQRGSSAIDQATTPSALAVDIDGDSRPQGNARDQGADEVP